MSATPDSTLANPEQLIADLERQLAECKAERDEGLQRESATAEVLQVINSSPGNLDPVFDAMLERALRLCKAACGTLWTYDGAAFRLTAQHDVPNEFDELLRRVGPVPPQEGSPQRRLMDGEQVIQVQDLAADTGPSSLGMRAALRKAGARTNLWIALRKDSALRGAIHMYRKEVRPFSDRQIALLQNFAAQAVIAMENARLLIETREALEQQTATAEVLQVINSSPGDLTPVIDAILDKAMQLCEASHAHLFTFDGEKLHPAAVRGEQQFAEWLREHGVMTPPPGSSVDRMLRGEPFVHMLDATDVEPYRVNPWFRQLMDRSGSRTTLNVPLRRDDVLLGTMHLYRPEVRPFSEKQIALLQNFAAQAIIAMENARLLWELRQRTDEVAELNRGLEARVAEQVEELGRVGRLKRFSRAAAGRADRLARRREDPRKSPPRDRRGVLRFARLHRLH